MRAPVLPATLALVVSLALLGCNRTSEPISLRVEGEVSTAPSAAPIEGGQWSLFERAVLDGALQAEEQVAQATSDEAGLFTAEFERRSSYSLRWTAAADRHFPLAGELDPDDLLPNVPIALPLSLAAVCTLHVNLASLPPEDSTDVMRFNLGEDFPCACCETEQVLLEGVGADSSWSCLMHGDRWMTWGADLDVALIGQPDGLFIDSVFCPAFGAATLDLAW